MRHEYKIVERSDPMTAADLNLREGQGLELVSENALNFIGRGAGIIQVTRWRYIFRKAVTF